MKKILTFVFAVLATSIFAQVDVTFQVDMSGQTVSADGVHIAGSLNGWSTDANLLQDQGSNIYAVTLSLQPGTDYEYKFLNGNAWGTEEAAPATCTIGGSNRIFTAPSSEMTIAVTPFNDCPTNNETQMVKFSVDMTGQTVSANGVHVAGNFNGWSPGATALSDIGNNIYEVTVPVFSSLSVLQYKFINGNDWGAEETPGTGCANGESNRPFILKDAGSSVDLPVATFGGCSNPVPTKTLVFTVRLAGITASTNGVHLGGTFQDWDPAGTPMTDIGNDTYELSIDIMNTTMYLEYKYLNGNAWGDEETVPEACAFNDNRYKVISLSNAGPISLENYEFGTCNNLNVSTSSIQTPLFQIAPTVATESVLVTWETPISEQAELVVYNFSGKVVFQEKKENLQASNETVINVNDWAVGMYVVSLRTANSQYSQKIVVE